MRLTGFVLPVVCLVWLQAGVARAQAPSCCPADGGSLVRETPLGISPGASMRPGSGGLVLPYSYYVTAPQPARIYAGYGPSDQFPFYGRAYGNPGDRWSWYYMGGGERRYLAKYYYPLLP